jgi:ketosteroid isomerase-like protein
MSTNVMQASELARKYIETLGAGRVDECVNLFRDDAVLLFPKTISTPHRLSKEDFRAMLGRASSVFDGWPHYSLIHQTSESNRSCIEFRGVGRLKGGAEFEFLYCIVFVAEDGLITEMREYLDTHHMLTTFKSASARDPA